MRCANCKHMPYQHHDVTYPKRRSPCDVCLMCGQTSKDCCLTPKRCPCTDFKTEGDA
jgi:hypothetical protein